MSGKGRGYKKQTQENLILWLHWYSLKRWEEGGVETNFLLCWGRKSGMQSQSLSLIPGLPFLHNLGCFLWEQKCLWTCKRSYSRVFYKKVTWCTQEIQLWAVKVLKIQKSCKNLFDPAPHKRVENKKERTSFFLYCSLPYAVGSLLSYM